MLEGSMASFPYQEVRGCTEGWFGHDPISPQGVVECIVLVYLVGKKGFLEDLDEVFIGRFF